MGESYCAIVSYAALYLSYFSSTVAMKRVTASGANSRPLQGRSGIWPDSVSLNTIYGEVNLYVSEFREGDYDVKIFSQTVQMPYSEVSDPPYASASIGCLACA